MSDGEGYSCPSCSWSGNEPKKSYWGNSEPLYARDNYAGVSPGPSGETLFCPECGGKIGSRNYLGESNPATLEWLLSRVGIGIIVFWLLAFAPQLF